MKVGIVGAGQVGATTAYSLVMHGRGRKVVLVDVPMSLPYLIGGQRIHDSILFPIAPNIDEEKFPGKNARIIKDAIQAKITPTEV